MKKLIVSLVITFSFATSYISADNATLKNHKSVKIEKVATPQKKIISKTEKVELSPAQQLYQSIDFSGINRIEFDVFETAFRGFNNLKKAGHLDADAKLLTVCDFSKSSNYKRLWVIDTEKRKVLFNSLVAHGKNTGEEFAIDFSNVENSLQSSIGFYITDTTYEGENGYSLKLLGMDKGYNDAALQRAIVMHGADYVSEEFAAANNRIGRSWGCPAVPKALTEPIINTIKGKNALFIYFPDYKYLNTSEWLKLDK